MSTHILENPGPKTNGPPMLRVPLPAPGGDAAASYAHACQEGGCPDSPQQGIHDVSVHIRGRYDRLGPIVARRFPVILAGGDQPPLTEGSGRLQLARWLAQPENPLTARVMVNRIWQHHFGEGLVRTPSNFGKLGELPTHSDLLDWLAAEFIRTGWSIKAMHRLIMLSSAYQQSSVPSAAALERDADNRLLSRMNPRRLDAEQLRDSMLSATGELDETRGGPAVREIGSPRRTLYLMTIRSDRGGFRDLFDGADATAIVDKRNVSTVAPQALFMMNHPFVQARAERLAERILANAAGAGERIDRLYEQLFARPASDTEQELGRSLLAEWQATAAEKAATDALRDAWRQYCLVLLCSNEFAFID